MKVHQRGACRRDNAVLPYISVLLAMKFTTPEIPFLLTKWSVSIVEGPVLSAPTVLVLWKFLYSQPHSVSIVEGPVLSAPTVLVLWKVLYSQPPQC